jgi:hypothetical protein
VKAKRRRARDHSLAHGCFNCQRLIGFHRIELLEVRLPAAAATAAAAAAEATATAAAATTAAAAEAATTATTTAEATATATTTATILAGASLVHGEVATIDALAMEGLDCRPRLAVIVHLDEAKATGTTGLAVHDDGCGSNLAVGLKDLAKALFGRAEREITNVELHVASTHLPLRL